MLFQFGYFWKFLLTVFGTWGSYALFGFEFTTVTLLAILITLYYKNTTILL